jgi:SAM-dependent methyltransferase
MADRHHGYDSSVAYPSYFIREMGPDWLDFCIRAQGYEAPRTAPNYRYLDLGCGQGFHLCLLAAANPRAEFVGIDFDPEYIAHGQELASAGGLTNIRFVRADFLDLAADWPKDLGAFDYIALQGILSWVSPELRAAAIQCVAGGSKPGTVAAFGYNTPPGWLGAIPFQHIASEFRKGSNANVALGRAIGMFRRLSDLNAPLFDQVPRFKKQLELLAVQPPGYLAHEFLPDHWTSLWHSAVARDLGEIGFTYVGSAAVTGALLPDSLAPELRAVIVAEADEMLRQDVQDIVISQQFRRDIFCRAPRRAEGGTLPGETPIYLLSTPPEGAPVHLKTSFGGLTVDYEAVADIVASLADGPKTVAELMALENPARRGIRSILLAMLESKMLMVGASEARSDAVANHFNSAVARAVAGGTSYRYLASAALGSGVSASKLDLLMLDAWLSAGPEIDSASLAERVAERFRNLGQHLQFRGNPVAHSELESHIAKLTPAFIEQKVPQWRGLGVLQ